MASGTFKFAITKIKNRGILDMSLLLKLTE